MFGSSRNNIVIVPKVGVSSEPNKIRLAAAAASDGLIAVDKRRRFRGRLFPLRPSASRASIATSSFELFNAALLA